MLCIGFGAFINGNKALAQNMMRARVAFQGLTILAMGVASTYAVTVGSEPEGSSSGKVKGEPGPRVV